MILALFLIGILPFVFRRSFNADFDLNMIVTAFLLVVFQADLDTCNQHTSVVLCLSCKLVLGHPILLSTFAKIICCYMCCVRHYVLCQLVQHYPGDGSRLSRAVGADLQGPRLLLDPTRIR